MVYVVLCPGTPERSGILTLVFITSIIYCKGENRIK